MEFEDVPFSSSKSRQDPPIQYDLNVTYEELFSGCKKKMKVTETYLFESLKSFLPYSYFISFEKNCMKKNG